jgi:hypothetical protein
MEGYSLQSHNSILPAKDAPLQGNRFKALLVAVFFFLSTLRTVFGKPLSTLHFLLSTFYLLA